MTTQFDKLSTPPDDISAVLARGRNSNPLTIVPGFEVGCTTCKGFVPETVLTRDDALALADRHLSLDSGHKSHHGHVVTIKACEVVTKPARQSRE